MAQLNNGDPNRPIRFEVIDYDHDSAHDPIGTCTPYDDTAMPGGQHVTGHIETTTAQFAMLVSQGQQQIPLKVSFEPRLSAIPPPRHSAHVSALRYSRRVRVEQHPAGKNKNVGYLGVRHFQVTRIASFVEYLRGGCELSLIAAIDFTASNGDPRTPSSLHFRKPQGDMNE
jgi:hypothetical protein